MKTYIIDYIDTSGDVSHIWLNAENEKQAKSLAKEECWDIKEIVQIYPD